MKQYIKSLFFIFITVIAINARVNAQTTWQLSQSVGNVDFYYSLTNCNSQTVVFLKFVNKNSSSVTVSWKEVFDTQYESAITGYSGQKQMTLAPGVTEQANCSSTSCSNCLVVANKVNPAYVAKIEKFSFTNVTVK